MEGEGRGESGRSGRQLWSRLQRYPSLTGGCVDASRVSISQPFTTTEQKNINRVEQVHP